MLYLIATPIGNLSDITLRALEVLNSCDYVLCEDTKKSRILMNHHGIQKPLKSYHRFNEAKEEKRILADLQEGRKIALISDGGTPAISDPGYRLIECCQREGIAFTTIPGACSIISALLLSGLSTERFQFIGFLAKKSAQLNKQLIEFFYYPGTTICFESPQRIVETVQLIAKQEPEIEIAIVREITKIHETSLKGEAKNIALELETHPPKGEVILCIAGNPEKMKKLSSLSPMEEIEQIQKKYSLSKQEAIKLVASFKGVSKRSLYKSTLNLDS